MSQIKERPILFSAPMVRAILEGRKTVTRRPVKGGQIPTEDTSIPAGERQRWSAIGQRDPRYGFCVFGATEVECAKELAEFAPCPYGRKGERLWVRETWLPDPDADHDAWYDHTETYTSWSGCGSRIDGVPPALRNSGHCIYKAGWEGSDLVWRPSIHMPRWACRILLEITDVRVERLQDISDEQAKAEGIIPHVRGGWHWHAHNPQDMDDWHQFGFKSPVWAFHDLWVGINSAENWDANPWVWVVEFKKVTP